MHIAAASGKLAIIRYLCSLGLDLNKQDNQGKTVRILATNNTTKMTIMIKH